MTTNKKGDRRERELVNLLDDLQWAVMRAPASGSATERALPDVLIGNGTHFYAIEAKASGGQPIYLTEDEVDALKYFAANFGAVPVIAVKFDVKHGDEAWGNDAHDGWYYFTPDELYRTDSGNYRVKKEKAVEDGATTDGLWTGLEDSFCEFDYSNEGVSA